MATADDTAARRRRLLLPGLLALLIHLLALLLVNPRPAPEAQTIILRPLIYDAPPEPVTATPAPRPRATPTRRPRPVAVPEQPAATPETPMATPAPPPDEPAPAQEAAAAPAPLAAASAPATPPPVEVQAFIPGSLRLKYALRGELSSLTYQASGELLWAHDGQNYEARMEVGAFLLGSRVQHSRGRITPAGLQPQRFVDRVRQDRVAEFDQTQGQIRFSEGAPPVALPQDAQDQLSVFVQLGSLISTTPQRYPRGTAITLPAVGVYGPESWSVVVEDEETLSLPGGELRALKLSRAPTRADEPRAEIWLAPALGWLPARIRLSQENGDFIDQQWRGSGPP
ncbi:MAG: DUF3108 domain-containing protein [Hylemonella sp.]|nr:DUF3108 domain-containing protein [Hylemonella sp.]